MDNEKPRRLDSEDGHHEHIPARPSDDTAIASHHPKSSSSSAGHPLAGHTREQLARMGEQYAREHQGLTDEDDIRAFRLGAIIAGDLDAEDDTTTLKEKYAAVEGLTEEERQILVEEVEKKWRHPAMLYFLVTGPLPCCIHFQPQNADPDLVQCAPSAPSFRVWTRPSSTALRSSTRNNSASTRKAAVIHGLSVFSTQRRTFAARSSAAVRNTLLAHRCSH